MERIIVLGAGRVGSAIARDLARMPDLEVTAADASTENLSRLRQDAERDGTTIRTLPVELADARSFDRAVDEHELAIGAVPGPMGFQTLRRALDAGLHVVDISFFEEDAYELDDLARRRGRVAVVDAGVAPGLSNLVLGHHEARLRSVDRFECLVGGIPAERVPPWEYRAPFSPIDVIAEYTRPARLRRAGQPLTLPALSELEDVEMPGVGTLEAFVTDGLRTLLRTSEAPTLVEKTLRWPGHADRMRVMRDSGFFDEEPVELEDGTMVSPIRLSAHLLFDAWRYREGEEDLTAMRVVVDGEDEQGRVRHTYDLLDRYDRETRTSSMARTTGYTATGIARLVLAGAYHEPGISPPERVAARDGALESVLGHLASRGIRIEHREERPGS
jgi:lysine 6-dehydrogenase